jgi:hypothetical protein
MNHSGDGGLGEQRVVDKLFGQLFGYLIEQLSSYATPTGTLLDEGVSIWLSDVATGDHSPNNLPYVVAGSNSGWGVRASCFPRRNALRFATV